MNPAVFLKNCGVQPRPSWPWLRVVSDGPLVTLRVDVGVDVGLNGVFHVTGEMVYPSDRQGR